MTDTRTIDRAYQDVGPLNAHVLLDGWVDDGVFLTKGGELGLFVAWDGVDYEGLDALERDAVARRFERALRLFDDRFRVYQYLLKLPINGLPAPDSGMPAVDRLIGRRQQHIERGLYTVRLYASIVYEGWRPDARLRGWRQALHRRLPKAIAEWFSPERVTSDLEASLRGARDVLRRQVEAWRVQLDDLLHPRILDEREAFAVLRQLVNYTPGKADLVRRSGARLDVSVADAEVGCFRNHLTNDDLVVRPLILKTAPDCTFAHLLRPYYEMPFPLLLVTEWRREAAGRTRREIRARRRHFHNQRHSVLNYVTDQRPAPGDVLVDDGATARVQALGRAIEATEMEGVYFGEFSLTVIVHANDLVTLDERVSTCQKVFTVLDDEAALLAERANGLHAWLSVVPGNHVYNRRRMRLPNTAYADLSLVFGLDQGDVRNPHLQAPALVVLETAHRTPFNLNLHVADVAHTLLLGATGSGKSFLANLLIAHALRYRPRVTVFDLGGSYARLVARFGGSMLRLTLTEQACTINPFATPPTPDHLQFLFAFVRILIESGGQYAPTTGEDRDLYEQIVNLYELEPSQRRLGTLARVLRRPLGDQLQRWVAGGPYGMMFDNVSDTLSFAPLQLVDLQGLERHPQILEPLLFYLLQRASITVDEPDLAAVWKLFVLDEAWRFLRHPRIHAFFLQAFKTFRKRNGSVLLATQSSEDLARSEMLRVAVESCSTWLFMANPGFDREAYRTVFQLSDAVLDQLAVLTPRHELLVKQPGRTKLLTLAIDSDSLEAYRTDSPSSADS